MQAKGLRLHPDPKKFKNRWAEWQAEYDRFDAKSALILTQVEFPKDATQFTFDMFS
ncbi:hypothetical protein ABZ345_31915 [Lentzea sp. NPDC005914]|uniref:hypothetical protein n=1 Tax=Lentzea sp. NPDC005914 TaxID=3154572 RepID=UPI0033CEA1D7